MFDITSQTERVLTLLKVSEKKTFLPHPNAFNDNTSDNQPGIVCTEHLNGLVLIKGSVNKNNILNNEIKCFLSEQK